MLSRIILAVAGKLRGELQALQDAINHGLPRDELIHRVQLLDHIAAQLEALSVEARGLDDPSEELTSLAGSPGGNPAGV